MPDEYHERPANEIRAFDDYWGLGPSRSPEKLWEFYRTYDVPDDVPVDSLAQIKRWRERYQWEARCAEREAALAEKSEALVEEDRVILKRKRIQDQKQVITISMGILKQCEKAFVGEKEAINPFTGDVEMVPKLSTEQLLKLYPHAVKALIAAQNEQKQELGDDAQRQHITIEHIVNALPAEMREPMRDLLYEQLLRPGGNGISE